MDGTNELATRKRKAAAVFNTLRKLWIRGIPVSIETKMKIYNGTVLPHSIQSSRAMVLKKTELDKLEAAHRSQLRRLIGIFYPEHITTEDLYKRTGARPLSIDITRARWSLIGHILRLAEKTPEIPAYQAMLNTSSGEDSKEKHHEPKHAEDEYSPQYRELCNSTYRK